VPFINEENIGRISFISSMVIVILLTTVLGIIFIHDEYSQFQYDIQKVRETFIDFQKRTT